MSTSMAPAEAVSEATADRPAMVVVSDLHKSYGTVHAVRGVSFDVRRGEVFGLLGPNGAGKTTILEMVEGMLPIDRGSVTVDGIDVAREPERVRRLIGISLQKTTFFERLTLAELLRLFADLYETSVRVDRLLERVGLADQASRQVKTLSGGQQQRFAIAVALVNDPPLLFLDELLATGFHKDIVVQAADLEDVFLHMTGKQLRTQP